MKKSLLFSLTLTLLFSALIGSIFNPLLGAASFFGSLFPKEKGLAFMGLQREVWLPSLQEQYEQKRDWMTGLSDLSAFVDANQVLHFAEIGDYPEVYKNRNTDIDEVEPDETPNEVPLDTYDSQNYKIRKIGLYGIPYAKVEAYTRQSAEAIRLKEAKACAYAISPDEDSAPGKKIIIPTTGNNNGIGLKGCTIQDIAKLAQAMDVNKFPEPETGRHIVLTTNQWWEVVLSNDILKGQLERQQMSGVINPIVVNYYGLNIWRYDAEVGFDVTTNKKAPEGSVVSGNVVPLGFAFCTREAWKAEGAWSLFDKPINTNTRGRAYEFGFQHRFKAGMFRNALKYTAGIYSAKA